MFLMRKTEPLCDPDELAGAYDEVVRRLALREAARERGSKIVALSLTSRPGAGEPLYDGNTPQFDPETHRRVFHERDFTQFNSEFAGTIFEDIYNKLGFRAGRMRLQLLPPLTVFPMHRDSAPRAHMAVRTDSRCFLTSGKGESHHVPADGRLYVFNTRDEHTAYNAGDLHRVHLTVALADEEGDYVP
jgi:hypothetical protein